MSSKFLDKTGLDTFWAKIKSTFQTLGNLVTAWGSTPSDTKYPSEKLVKAALDGKAASSHTHGKIQNDGTIISDTAVASGDKLVITDSSDSNKVARSGLAFDDTTTNQFLSKYGTFRYMLTADAKWGGKFTTVLSPGDTYFFMQRNCFFGAKASAISVEYSTDGGTTWIDYGLTNDQKISLFSQYGVAGAYCGKNTHIQPGYTGSISGTKDLTDDIISNQRLRITIARQALSTEGSTSTTDGWMYCNLRRIGVYMSSQSANATGGYSHCVFSGYKRSDFRAGNNNWTVFGDYKVAGDSGWNSIPCNNESSAGGSITFGANYDSHYVAIRLEFWCDKLSASPAASKTGNMLISRITGFSELIWSNSSINPNMANTGMPCTVSPTTGLSTFSYGIKFTGRKLAVSLSNTSTDTSFDGSADVTNIKVSDQLADANIASAATWNAKQDALATQTAYSAKGSATKVPQITTNALGQVTNIEEIDIGYINSTDIVVGNENDSTPFLLYEISNVGLTQSYTTAVTELMVYLVRSSAAAPESAPANHMSFKVSIHWQWSLVRTNVEGSLPFGTVTAVLVNSATPTAGSDVSTLKIYLTPGNYVSYRVVVTDNRIRGNGDLVRGTITKRRIREAIPTASDLVIVGTTNVMTMQTKENLITSWNSTPSDTVYPSEKLVKTGINSAVQALDVSSVGGAGKYISAISETDGKISATETTMDPTPTANSTNAATSGGIKAALDGKSATSHTHSVTINGTAKTIPASGDTAVDLGTYKVFNYARVYATQTYDANTNRYILLAFKAATYTTNWEESSMFKLVVHYGQVPKELAFRLWLKGGINPDVVPADPSDPKLYRVYSENFSESELDILDVRLFVVEKSAGSISFTIGIFIDRNYLQAQYVSYQLYPLSYGTRDRGNIIDNGLSSWTYTVGQDEYYENIVHDNVFTTAFEVSDLPISMIVKDAYDLSEFTGPITSLNTRQLPSNIICPYGYIPQPGGSYIALSQFLENKTHRFELWQPMSESVWLYNNLGVTIVYRTVSSSGYIEYDILPQEVIILNKGGSRVKPTSAWATLIGTNLYVTFGY